MSSLSNAGLLAVVSDRIARAFIRSGATEAALYLRLLTGFGMLVFFTDLRLLELQVKYLALFLLFSVNGSFERFWMGSHHRNVQLMLKFLKAPFLILLFSYSFTIAFTIQL